MEHRRLDRREFTLEGVLAALSGVVITISGCGGGGGGGASYSSPSAPSTPAPTPAVGSSDKEGSISDNHGHSAVITAAQLVAGNAVLLDIRGAADHTHTVTLNADAIQAVQAGGPVVTDSTSTNSTSISSHLHTVTFNADSAETPTRY